MKGSYSFYINGLKKFLFTFSFFLIVLTFLNKSVDVFTDFNSNEKYNIDEAEEVVINPKFLGLDKKKRPYEVLASKAQKVSHKDKTYFLYQPSGKIKSQNNKIIFLKSDKGTFDQINQTVYLYENVELKNSDGSVFKTNSATIDLKTNEIFGTEIISGISEKGNIVSEGFNIFDEGNKIIFNGKTNLILKKQ